MVRGAVVRSQRRFAFPLARAAGGFRSANLPVWSTGINIGRLIPDTTDAVQLQRLPALEILKIPAGAFAIIRHVGFICCSVF